jgi:chaperonin GroEL (HSP60 family)
MDIEHPAAQMLSEVAETQEEEVGDGTTTAAVLAGELLSQAEDLLDEDVHPTTIVEGYYEAAALAHEAVDEATLDGDVDEEQLIDVAESSMTGKGTGDIAADGLSETVVDAVEYIRRNGGVDRDSVTIHAQAGASSSATELVEGVIADEEPVHDEMPGSVGDASIAVIDEDFEVKESNVDAEYSVESVDQLNAALDAEDEELRSYADALAGAGVEIAFVDGDIEDRVASYLAAEGILAFESVDSDDAKSIAAATGATRVGSVGVLDADDLGEAERVRVRKFGDEELVFVEGGAAAESVTVFARGGTEHVVDELERALRDALDVVTAALEEGGVVAGAGATEIAVADHIREAAASVEGRKQLAVEAYADAVDVLPRTLAENTGMDPIDALVDLRARHEETGRAGVISEGQSGVIDDPVDYGVLDPAAIKHEAVESATEAATMIVRIDDVIAAN